MTNEGAQNDGATDSKQTTIDGTTMVGGTDIEAVTGDDDREILGWIVPFTIGNDFVVPRDWLENRASDLGLSPRLLPSDVSDKRAFTRAGNRVDDRMVAAMEKGENVEINLEKVKYKRIFHVEVHDRRDEERFDGELIGVIRFDTEHGEPDYQPRVDPSHEMYETWEEYRYEFEEEYQLMRNSNLGEDIRHMIVKFFRSRSRSVKFRAGGGVYFAPVASEAVVKSLDQLVTEIDREHKKSGFPCELDTIEVADSDEKRSMVEEKVRRNLEQQVSDLVEDAIDELADEDVFVDELIGDLESELDDVEGFANQYNALLDAEMTVREYLEEWRDTVTGEAEEMVEGVLEMEDDDEEDDAQIAADPVPDQDRTI